MVRYKQRYLVVKINVGKPNIPHFGVEKILKTLRHAIKYLHGDYGVGAVAFGLRVKYCNAHTRILLIRAMHGAHRFVATALPFVKQIDDDPVTFVTLYVGATMRKCFVFVQKYQKLQLKKIWIDLSESERKEFQKAFLKISTPYDKAINDSNVELTLLNVDP